MNIETVNIDNIYNMKISDSELIMENLINHVSDILNNSTHSLPHNMERQIRCSCEHSNAIFTVTLLKYSNDEHMYLSARRRINIIMFQDIPTGNISVSIINGEEHKQKILYRLISLNPTTSIEKYLPTIINSMIDILDKS